MNLYASGAFPIGLMRRLGVAEITDVGREESLNGNGDVMRVISDRLLE